MIFYRNYLIIGIISLLALSALKPISEEPMQVQETIRIWIKAFIPKNHPGNPSYIKPVPNRLGLFMIPSPVSIPILGEPNICYLTDNRDFSTDPQASARLTSEFELQVNGTTATIVKVGSRDIHRANETEKVFCSTGVMVAKGTAQVKVPFTTQPFGIGGPHVAGSQIQVIFQAAAQNPIVPAGAGLAAPTIDYDADLIYDKVAKKLTFRATHGVFPAFEAYASRNGGPVKTLFRAMPEGASTWSLFDGGLGVASRVEKGEITF